MVNTPPTTHSSRSRQSSFGLLCCTILTACSVPPVSAPKLQEQSAGKEAEIAALEREQAKLLAEVKRQMKTARQAGPVDENARRKLEELEQLVQAIETR